MKPLKNSNIVKVNSSEKFKIISDFIILKIYFYFFLVIIKYFIKNIKLS